MSAFKNTLLKIGGRCFEVDGYRSFSEPSSETPAVFDILQEGVIVPAKIFPAVTPGKGTNTFVGFESGSDFPLSLTEFPCTEL